MIVVCKVNCSYNDGGFCSRRTTAIDENGMCSMWWRKGQRHTNSEMEQKASLYKEKITIIDVNKNEVRDVNELCRGTEVSESSYRSERTRDDSEEFNSTDGESTGSDEEVGQDGKNDREGS